MIPTYYTFLDWTANLSDRFKKKTRATLSRGKNADPASMDTCPIKSTREKILDEAVDRYENIVGRFDTLGKIPSRTLVPPQTDEDREGMMRLGLKPNEQGEWIVPDGVPLEPFELWLPEVPLDLRDKTPRYLKTRNGRSVASYIEVSDRAKGCDSTATSLLYGAIVLVSALSFFASSIAPILGFLVALLLVPFTIALSQAEGPMEGAKALVLLGIAPLVMALATVNSLSGTGVLGALVGAAGRGGAAGAGALAISFLTFVVIVLVGSFVLDRFDPNRRASIIGGTFQKFKSVMLWSFVYASAFAISQFLPLFIQPAFYFAMASIYPMVYTNANFVRRAKLLERQGKMFNLERLGALSSAHIEAKEEQAIRAYNDNSPLFKIGTATGWLTKKHYPLAPDQGTEMVLSALDSTMHVFMLGKTGGGKTTNGARPYAKQWWESGWGGMLILCGKGLLAGDLSSLIDIRIGPGVDFAPLQGLDGTGVSTALNSIAQMDGGGSSSNGIWIRGASDFIVHACQIHEALNKHEIQYLKYASSRVKDCEANVEAVKGLLDKARSIGEGVEEATLALEVANDDLRRWTARSEKPRQWLWNIDTLVKIFNIINSPYEKQGAWVPGQELEDALVFLGHMPTIERLATELGKKAVNTERAKEAIYPAVGAGGVLDAAISYVLDFWIKGIGHEQRGSYFMNVSERIMPIVAGPELLGEHGAHWKTLEVGADAGMCLYGKSVAVDLPEEIHQRAGILISALVKQRIYNGVARRGSNPKWREEGQKPILVMIDECQDLVSDAERQLLPKARSLGMTAYMLTQEIEGLINKFGNVHKAYQFLNTFQSLICMRTSSATYEYIAKRIGVAPMLTYSQVASGIDMDAGVGALAASPLSDDESPYYSAFRKMERAGAGRLAVKKRIGRGFVGQRMVDIEDDEIASEIIVPHGGKLEIQPIFKPEEFTSLTTFGHAIVLLNRAGENRFDVAKLHPVFEDELRKK